MGTTMSLMRAIWYMITIVILRSSTWILFSTNKLQFTVSLSVFIVMSAIIVYITYCVVRARILSQYKKLTPDNDDFVMNQNNIHSGLSDSATQRDHMHYKNERKSSNQEDDTFLSSYLDQFLSAIKIFGYLEKPVFHDLTKNMKTQKLDEGEILLLDNSIGFAIVVEGTLQVYHEVEEKSSEPMVMDTTNHVGFMSSSETNAKGDDGLSNSQVISDTADDSSIETDGDDDDDDDDDDDSDEELGYIRLKNGLGRFQLLNTVKPGNPVSSLVNILNLFTTAANNDLFNANIIKKNRGDSNELNLTLRKFIIDADKNDNNIPFDATPPPPLLSQQSPSLSPSNNNLPDVSLSDSMPKVVGVAATDCTIAIIPPQAFAKLTAKYPRSASHIIQMILTKLYNVTLQTAHNYLGLTKEIMNIELTLNKSVNYEIPYYLKEAVMRKFSNKDKPIVNERKSYETSMPNFEKRPSSFDIPSSPTSKQSSNLNLKSPVASKSNRNSIILGSRHVVLDSRDHFNPGDLLSNVPLSRKETMNEISTRRRKSPLQKSSHHALSAAFIEKEVPKRPNLKNKDTSTDFREIRKQTNNIIDRSFSSIQEETEESAVRMAIVEALFGFLGINKDNMSLYQTNTNQSNGNFPNTHRSSEISLVTSFESSSTPRTTLRILPSHYTIQTKKQMKKNKNKKTYKEEVFSNLDFESAKSSFMQGIKLQFFKQGTRIVEQNSNGKGMFYVIAGKIDVTTTNEDELQVLSSGSKQKKQLEHHLFTVSNGGIAGYLSSVIGYKSFVNLNARTDVYVGFLPNDTLENLCDKYFLIYLRIAETLTSMLSTKLLKLDHALEWIHLTASETLFKQGDPANGIYVVLNGRLRQLQDHRHENNDINKTIKRQQEGQGSVRNDDETYEVILGEHAQGESFGEVEVLTAMDRISTIVAVRDSELVRIPRTLFELLALEHPSIMIRVSRLVARKILSNNSSEVNQNPLASTSKFNLTIPTANSLITSNSYNGKQNTTSGSITFRTITILPIREGLPVELFAMKLVQAFKQVGRTTIGLNQRTTLTHLGRHAFDRLAKLKQSGYFAELEEMFQTVVYIADTPSQSSWTKTCIAQGDCILLLADANSSPDIGEFENLVLKSKTTARTGLILLHPERYVEPGLTQKWLRYRPWVHSHHHIQMAVNSLESISVLKTSGLNGGALALMDKLIQTEFSRKTQQNISRLLPDSIKSKVENFSGRFMRRRNKQFYTPTHMHKNDFLRLARILSGQAIGLVLGGGGARGLSHLGMIQAIEEQGIPIDMIGGTSMGSFVGGLYAKDYDLVPIYGRVKKFAGRLSSIWRTLSDLTWPVTSYTTGHEFNRGIWKTFGETRIEDFWIQYYCNSTNITDSVQEIHSFGYAWRYIRASMSLAGLLPPLEENGSMLLDGGYLDNLPVSEMKLRGCNTIFAVDVGSVDDRTPMKYGDSLNGFWIVFNRWNPFSTHPNIPNMAEIQVRLGYVASVNALENAKNTPGVIYIRPPIDNYATLDFGKFEEIYGVGVDYGRVFFQELETEGNMPKLPGCQNDYFDTKVSELLLHRRNSI